MAAQPGLDPTTCSSRPTTVVRHLEARDLLPPCRALARRPQCGPLPPRTNSPGKPARRNGRAATRRPAVLIDSGWAGDPALKALWRRALPPVLASDSRAGSASWNMYGRRTRLSTSTGSTQRSGRSVTHARRISRRRRVLNAVPPAGGGGVLIAVSDSRAAIWAAGDRRRFVTSFASVRRSIYRTGDLVRRRRDGRLDYIARMETRSRCAGRAELARSRPFSSTKSASRGSSSWWQHAAGDQKLVDHDRADERRPRRDQAYAAAHCLVQVLRWWSDRSHAAPPTATDRKALPSPRRTVASAREYVGRHPRWRALAQIWGELLGSTAWASTKAS